MVIELLQQLVSIPSVSGGEAELASFLANHLDEQGFKVAMEGNNLAFSVGSGGAPLIFNAHIDTVEPSENWEHDPYSAEKKDGRVYGIGASDNKASVAALVAAAERLKEHDLVQEVVFTFVTKEETDGSGTQTMLDWLDDEYDLEDAAAVVTEPTDLAWMATGCRGTCFISLTVEAEGGHASKQLQNPIEELYRIYGDVTDLLARGEEQDPKVTMTSIHASESPNTIPATAEAVFDVRTVPGMTAGNVRAAFEEAVSGVDASVTFAADPCPPGVCRDEAFIELVQDASGITETRMSPASNDSCFFTAQNIPAVVLGPGFRDVIHQPDEFVETEKVKKAVETFTSIAAAWCA
ncbi:MAG: M20/M25/M40 family metallo-hydrolase [Candidatus Nanohaloarchaea archaeon]|nr:M20/M25/M40 family metallo-hydrolase [Candidatus Nanohaloarchaea archaeon]